MTQYNKVKKNKAGDKWWKVVVATCSAALLLVIIIGSCAVYLRRKKETARGKLYNFAKDSKILPGILIRTHSS